MDMKIARTMLISLLAATLAVQPTSALENAILSDAQIQSIRDNCVQAKLRLQQLHVSDAALRVNLGQRYENLGRRLMAPLNARIAANNLDGVDLAQTTVRYTNEYKTFSNRYLTYDESIESALAIDCNQNPVTFYAAIENARENRAQVAKSEAELYQIAQRYGKQVEAFRKSLNDQQRSLYNAAR